MAVALPFNPLDGGGVPLFLPTLNSLVSADELQHVPSTTTSPEPALISDADFGAAVHAALRCQSFNHTGWTAAAAVVVVLLLFCCCCC